MIYKYLAIIFAIIIVLQILMTIAKKQKSKQTALDIKNAYKQKWLFSYNEKDAYKKLKEITDKNGLFLFAKVRLYDLIEPKTGIKNYMAYVGKIQSKHIDFVICDEKLVARIVVELDDASHNSDKRKERDSFVNEALQNVGYNVIHTKGIDKETKTKIENCFKKNENPAS